MSAKKNLNPNQYAMFIPAKELVDSGKYDSVDLGGPVRAADWQGKLDDSFSMERAKRWGNSKPLINSVREKGIERPVNIGHYDYGFKNRPEIGNGHHRIISAYAINPDTEVPVVHHVADDYNHVEGGYNGQDDDDYERENPY